VELTHYERVLEKCDGHDAYARSFAKKVAAAGEYEKYFRKIIAAEEPSQDLSEAAFFRHALSVSYKILLCTHYLTAELLRRDSSYNFTTLISDKDFGDMIKVASAATDQFTLNVAGHMHFHMAAHKNAGKKVYVPSSGLAEQLKFTELRGLTSEDLRLPHPSIYIQVPESAKLRVWNDESEWHRVVGIYVTEESNPRAWRFLVCGEIKPMEASLVPIYADNDALVYFHVRLPENMSLEDALAVNQDECIKNVQELNAQGTSTFDPMLDIWQDIFRWAMNVVLYASMVDGESEEVIDPKKRKLLDRANKASKGKKRSRLLKEANQIDSRRRCLLGRSVTAKRGSWELTVRVRVRGHWRNQPYGPERMYRRLQWIEPYWKGPVDAREAEMKAEVSA
jgi:hypothetical protein